MEARALIHGQHSLGWRRLPAGGSGARARLRGRCAAGDALKKTPSYLERVQGWQGPMKAAMTSGSLSAVGDLLAQFLTGQQAKSQGRPPAAYDPLRTLRMFGFGFCWYGPYQFYWYNLLDYFMPTRTTANFVAKVTLNQLALAPVTLAAVFAWNLVLTGQTDVLAHKLQHDLVPSMINGWKFWVPAASLNFYAVPLKHQVLYMSCCGMLWTAYLSYISAAAPQPAPQPALALAGGKGKGRAKKQ